VLTYFGDMDVSTLREKPAGRKPVDTRALPVERIDEVVGGLHRALDAGAQDATQLCAMAKRVATDAGFKAANDALQLLGGYGYLAEYGIEKIVRDLRVHQILEGTNEIMRLIVARELVGR